MNTNTDKDVLRRQERFLRNVGNIYALAHSSVRQHASVSKRACGTRDSCEV